MTVADALAIDDSAVVFSHSPDQLRNRPLVVLMHGRGSHEHDLAALMTLLPGDFAYASLRAPLRFEVGGFTWFAAGPPGEPPLASVDAAASAILDWLDRLAPAGPVAVAGFSQGGALATHLMRHEPDRFAAYVNLAGFIVPGDCPADARLGELRPPVFWGRDADDPVIPGSAVEHTRHWLARHSDLTARTYPDIGHSISREEIDDVGRFLRDHVG